MSDARRAIDRRLLALAIPSTLTLAAEPLYVLADTAIVGHISTSALGGLGLAAIVLTSATGLCNVLTWWTTSRMGFLSGARDAAGVARVSATVLWFGLGLGCALVALLTVLADPLLRLLGGEGAVLRDATTYLRIGALGLPGFLVAWAGMGAVRGQGDTRTPLLVLVAANVLNVVLEVWFVYGLDAGIAGSAWGTVIAQWTSGALFAWRLIRDARGTWSIDCGELRAMVAVWPSLVVRTAALYATLSFASAVAARVSVTTLAAHQVLTQLQLFVAMSLDGAATAGQILVAEATGAQSAAQRNLVIGRAVRLTLAASAVAGVVLLAGYRAIPDLFTDDRAVVDVAATALPVLALSLLPAGLAYLFDGTLMGEGDYRTVRWSTLAGFVAFSGFGVAVLVRPSLGLPVIWAGLAAWLTARAAVNATGVRGNRATLVA